MGLILDIILLAIMVISIVYGAKKGFFKSLMSLISGILALLIAITFTPALSAYVNDNYVIEPLANGIETTFLSIAETDESASGYDKGLLLKDSQFLSLMENAGYTEEEIEESFSINMGETSDSARITALAYLVATPIAKTVSDIVAFIILFVVSFILLKLLTFIIGLFLKLPALKELDTVMGVVFGIISAIFFAFVFSMMASHLSDALKAAAPGTFTENLIESSFIVKLLAKYNPISAVSKLLIG